MKVKQEHYPDLEIDNSEVDIIQIWQHGRDESSVTSIERWKLDELIIKLMKCNEVKSSK